MHQCLKHRLIANHVDCVICSLLSDVTDFCGLTMSSSDVAVVSGVRCERLATVLALEGFLTRVLADVSAQDARRCKRLAAVHALVRPLPAVHLQGFCLKKVDLCTEIFRYAVQYHLVCMSIFIYMYL